MNTSEHDLRKRILVLAASALALLMIVAALGVYRSHQPRAPFDARAWERARKGGPLALITMTPSKSAMACTLVETGELLGMSRDSIIDKLGRAASAQSSGPASPRKYTTLAWELKIEAPHDMLYVELSPEDIVQDAWVATKFSPDDRLPLQVIRGR